MLSAESASLSFSLAYVWDCCYIVTCQTEAGTDTSFKLYETWQCGLLAPTELSRFYFTLGETNKEIMKGQ